MASKVDTREPKARAVPLQRAGWILEALKYGDYEMQDAVGKIVRVEQKTVSKLVADIANGILMRQCRSLIENCDFPILMIEGHWIQDARGYLVGSRYTWEGVWNELQTIQDMGCRLQLTTSIAHTVERLFELEDYYNKESHPSALRHLSGDPYVTVLSQIDGISDGKAKAIEVAFPTLLRVAEATTVLLTAIPGMGEVLAKRVWQFFRTDHIRKDLELWE